MRKMFLVATLLFASPVQADPSLRIHYRDSVTLNVGQSVVVHGMRGRKCGNAPRTPRLDNPTTDLGMLSLGRVGIRESAACKGDTPAIEVIFTARRKGREEITLFGDTIQIQVR